MRNLAPLLTTTAAALLAAPALASAHTATIACDQQRPGQFTVTADYQRLSPVTTYGPTTATVRWADGFTVVLPLPSGCVPQAPSAPVMPELSPPLPPQNNFDITAPAPPPPVVVTPGAVEPQPRKRVTPRRVTCAWLKRVKAGPREYTKRGWYWRCKAPVARKVPRVAVTG